MLIGLRCGNMIRYNTKDKLNLRPKKIIPLFPVALPTLIFGADPKVFQGILRQALLKFYIDYVKNILKKFPTYRPYFYLTCNRKHKYFCCCLTQIIRGYV